MCLTQSLNWSAIRPPLWIIMSHTHLNIIHVASVLDGKPVSHVLVRMMTRLFIDSIGCRLFCQEKLPGEDSIPAAEFFFSSVLESCLEFEDVAWFGMRMFSIFYRSILDILSVVGCKLILCILPSPSILFWILSIHTYGSAESVTQEFTSYRARIPLHDHLTWERGWTILTVQTKYALFFKKASRPDWTGIRKIKKGSSLRRSGDRKPMMDTREDSEDVIL